MEQLQGRRPRLSSRGLATASSCGSSQQTAGPDDQYADENAEAGDIAERRTEIEKSKRFNEPQNDSADDHAERVVEAADNRNREAFCRQGRPDVRIDLGYRAVECA